MIWLVIGFGIPVCMILWGISGIYARRSISRQIDPIVKRLEEISHKPEDISEPERNEFMEKFSVCMSIIEKYGTEWDKLRDTQQSVQKMAAIVSMKLPHQAVSVGKEIETLAELRQRGIISDHEFQAFSERFKVSSAEKARGTILAIDDLHVEYKKGAMSEGNYHSSLWSLLDKLDRGI